VNRLSLREEAIAFLAHPRSQEFAQEKQERIERMLIRVEQAAFEMAAERAKALSQSFDNQRFAFGAMSAAQEIRELAKERAR
jgi:hypothetical protein